MIRINAASIGTLGKDGVEVAVTEAMRCATELWAALTASDLQIIAAYPLSHPAQTTIAMQEAAPEA